MATATKWGYPCVQREFIEATRAKIDAETDFFYHRDWRNVTPNTGKFCSLTKSVLSENFYIRPLACWVPHKLLPDFVPSCPYCRKSDLVNPQRGRWINSPKVLYGLKGHRYLDTYLYPCSRCKRMFTGYNPESMEIDAC